MDIDVRPFSGDPRGFYDAAERAFGEWSRDEDYARWQHTFEADRAVAAYDADAVVGTAGILTFDMTVPGGVLPAAGVTIVGVQPTHRRRGVLRRMMRLQLDMIHERGEPIAVLWASEGSIYQRFGYGLASLKAAVNVARDRSAFRQPLTPAGNVRFVDLDQATRRFPAIFDAIRLTRPGFWTRNADFWEHEFFPDPEHARRGATAAFHVVHDVAGEADGYARYRIRDEWKGDTPSSTLHVTEVLATNPAAYLDLWRYLLDVDLMGQADAWNLAVDDPLLLTIAEPRRLQMSVSDALWLRVVDVASALAGRRYRTDGSVVIEVEDEFCPWNDGRWELRVEDGVPFVGVTTDAADLRCDVTDLGAAYLGGFSFAQLADAGRGQELQPGGLLRADALFRTDRAPWCPRVF